MMENSLQTALKKLGENQATNDELELIRHAFSGGQIFIGGNVQNSVIIVGSGNSLQLTPEALERLAVAANRSALHQLPQPPRDFVGRKDEMKAILSNIGERKGAAISGITGMAGIGKTALGLISAHELLLEFSDAQFFIDLHGTSKKPLKAFDVLKHVIQSFYPMADLKNITEAELAGEYQSVLSDKKALLFFDNARDEAQIIPLLPPTSCCVLITSRWHFAVPGLQSFRLNILKEEDAIQLLIGLCPRLSEDEARQIAILCGHLPIALRLAGSFLQVSTDWSPAEYIAELSKKDKRLESLDLGESKANIETIFSLSYRQLSRRDQQSWSMLAVFPTSFSRNAAAFVWQHNDEKAHKLASKLCQYSLMQYDSITKRYHLHDLLTDFANKKLKEPNKGISFLNYFRYYRDVWKSAETLYTKGGDELTQGLMLFDSEFMHIETAYEWAVKNANSNQDVLAILGEIPDFVYLARIRLHPDQQIRWFQAALHASQQLEDRGSQNKILGNIGAALTAKGELRKAIQYFEQAAEITRQIGDRQRQGIWLSNVGAVYGMMGKYRLAIEWTTQALKIAREIGDRQRQGACLGNIGGAYADLGENRKALEYHEQAEEIAREIGDRPRQGIWLGNIGLALTNIGKYGEAIERFEQALEIAREIGDRQSQGAWLGNLGTTYIYLGEEPKAIEYHQQALEIAREIGDRQRQGIWLGGIGAALSRLGEYPEAIKCLEQALEISKEVDDRQHESEWYNQFGELYVRMKEAAKARENLEHSLMISKELGLSEIEGKCLFNFAKLSILEENKEHALQYSYNARSIFESIQSPELTKVIAFIEGLKE